MNSSDYGGSQISGNMFPLVLLRMTKSRKALFVQDYSFQEFVVKAAQYSPHLIMGAQQHRTCFPPKKLSPLFTVFLSSQNFKPGLACTSSFSYSTWPLDPSQWSHLGYHPPPLSPSLPERVDGPPPCDPQNLLASQLLPHPAHR